jgi:glucokinase
MPILAIDFGGTNIKFGIVDNGKILSSGSIPAKSDEGIRPRLNLVALEIKKMMEQLNMTTNDFRSMGIATPGIVDFRNNQVIAINKKYYDTVTVDFTKWSMETFHLPLIMDNDMNCAIIGEITYGCARDVKDAVMMSFGTGIGTAAVMDGRLVRGKHYQAGCLGGHFIIDYKGRVCTCGNRGCIEAHAATAALYEIAKERDGFADSALAKLNIIDYKALSGCMEKGDIFSRDFFDYLLECWGAGIVNLIHAYDPEVVILSGGLMKEQEKVVPYLKKYVVTNAWTPWGKIEFRVAKNPDASVLIGLYALCRDREHL